MKLESCSEVRPKQLFYLGGRIATDVATTKNEQLGLRSPRVGAVARGGDGHLDVLPPLARVVPNHGVDTNTLLTHMT